MLEKEQLLLDLKKIRENKYNLDEGESIFAYTDLMLKYIGDTNSELRDDLICTTFYEWICEKEYFSQEELRHMLIILMDENHLFYHIGNDGDNTVFTRTFSILVVTLILYQHRKKSILTYDMFVKVKNNLIRYYQEEKDFRGYIDEYGWAHGAAHGADAMDELIQCKESDDTIYQEILQAIKRVLYNGKYIFYNEEDERITLLVYRIIKKNLIPYQLINNWIEELSCCCDWERTRRQYVVRVNTKNFVRCLYFRLMHNQTSNDISNTLFNVEGRLNRFLMADQDI